MTEPLLFILAGPSGVGKKTLMRRLRADHPNEFSILPVHTSALPTRRSSSGFYLVHHTRKEMREMEEDGELLSHWSFDGDLYGINKRLLSSYLEMCRVCFFSVEGVEGITRLRKCGVKATFIYVSPSSCDQYAQQLRMVAVRNTQQVQPDPRMIETRIRDARLMEDFFRDSSDLFHLRVLNSSVESSYQKISDLVRKRCRSASYHLNGSSSSDHGSSFHHGSSAAIRFSSILDLSILRSSS